VNITDGRRHKKDVKEFLRKEAHRRVSAGESVTKVMRELGLSRAAFYKQNSVKVKMALILWIHARALGVRPN